MLGAIKEHTGYDLTGMNEEQIREVCKKLNMEIDDTMGKGKLIDEIFGEFCEGTYIQPTFITDYPIEMSPLTKKHRDNPELTERFELMVNGKELCNAYSELNDPIDQLERFEDQMKLSEKGDDEAMIIDKDFVRALEYGMPPTSGMGIGMDRLTMLMTGQSHHSGSIDSSRRCVRRKSYRKTVLPNLWNWALPKSGYLSSRKQDTIRWPT